MSRNKTFALFGLMAMLVATAANAEAPEGAFRGMLVCEKLKTAANILRAPLDIIIRGNGVVFARPIFNAEGTRVVGSELAFGTIEADGKFRVTSVWDNGGGFRGDYSGTLTPSGGTLIGTEVWHVREMSETRTCVGAIVPVPGGRQSAPAK